MSMGKFIRKFECKPYFCIKVLLDSISSLPYNSQQTEKTKINTNLANIGSNYIPFSGDGWSTGTGSCSPDENTD
jgi:hypothetical protein